MGTITIESQCKLPIKVKVESGCDGYFPFDNIATLEHGQSFTASSLFFSSGNKLIIEVIPEED